MLLKRLPLLSTLLLAALAPATRAEEFFVSAYGSNSVTRWSAGGAQIGALTGTTLSGPQATRIGPGGYLYLADETNDRIAKFNANTGAFVGNFVSPGLSGLNGPTGMTWDSSGNMLVASFDNDSVYRYNSAGGFAGIPVGPGVGGLNGPDVGIAIGPDGLLYVPSFWNSRILRYNANTGAFVDTFVTPGLGGLQTPRTMLWRGGEMIVSDDFGSKVLRYNASTGAFLGTLITVGSGGLNGACGMTFTSSGDLLVTSVNSNAVLRYNGVTGAYLGQFIAPSAGLLGPTWITAVPEPSTMALMGLGLAAILRRRRR